MKSYTTKLIHSKGRGLFHNVSMNHYPLLKARQWRGIGPRQKVNRRRRIGLSEPLANCPVDHLSLPWQCMEGRGLIGAKNRARQTVMGTEDNYDASAARVQVCVVASSQVNTSVNIKSWWTLANCVSECECRYWHTSALWLIRSDEEINKVMLS